MKVELSVCEAKELLSSLKKGQEEFYGLLRLDIRKEGR